MSNSSNAAGFFNNKVYDVLKFLALVVFPALGALYFGLASIWSLPHPQDVVGSIVVFDTFLGVVLGLSDKAYAASGAEYDGTMDVQPMNENGVQPVQLNLDTHPENLLDKSKVSFKVRNVPPSATPGHLPEVPPVPKG